MELLYVWIEEYFVLKNIGFNFSNRYQIKEVVDLEKQTIKIELNERDDYVSDFFPKGILSVAAIVGENGIGKSTLLDFINKVNHRPDQIGCRWLAVYDDYKNERKVIWGNLIDYKNITWNVAYDKDLISGFWPVVVRNGESFRFSLEEPPIISIFYNPSLDLKDYGQSLNDIDAGLVNVSTNYLLEKDFEDKNSDDERIDQILNHRFKNVYRQFALSEIKTSVKDRLRIPDTIEVRFNKKRFKETSDLSSHSNDIFKLLDALGRDEGHHINGEIEEAQRTRDSANIKKAALKKVKNWFLTNLIDNYFYALSREYVLHGNLYNQRIGIDELHNKSFFESASVFFHTQDYLIGSNYSIADYMRSIYEIIDNYGEPIDRHTGNLNESFFYIPTKIAIKVHEANAKYLSLFKTKQGFKNKGFLDLNWRDLSNGEKAYLDLYSRLFDGYRKLQHLVEYFPTLYILIDEGELGFHPQWQKEYLSNLIKFISEVAEGLKCQIIISSHSPFVLSDLPKSNVILLNKNNSGETFVDQLPSKEQTFAANIHELFADSFFLRGGTIGDYAREKITQIIDSINRSEEMSKESQNDLLLKINMVGESIIKDRLLDMFNSRFGERETLEDQIKRLEEELKYAKDQMNRNDKN